MKKLIYISSVVLLSVSFLWGCSDGEGEQEITANPKVADGNGNKKSPEEIGDQVGLKIGETGIIEDTLGTYEVTVHSAEMKKTIQGYKPSNDILFLFDISIKNVGKSQIKAGDVVQAVDLLGAKGGGGTRATNRVKELNGFRGKGDVAPGEVVNGVMLFDILLSDHYKLAWNHNLYTLSNKVTWEFDASEAK